STGGGMLQRHDEPVIGTAGEPDEAAAPLLAMQRLVQCRRADAGQLCADVLSAQVQLAGTLGRIEDGRQRAGGCHGLSSIVSRNISLFVIQRESIVIPLSPTEPW